MFFGRFSARHVAVINQQAYSSDNLLFVFFHFRGFAFVQFKDPKQANAVKLHMIFIFLNFLNVVYKYNTSYIIERACNFETSLVHAIIFWPNNRTAFSTMSEM